MRFVVKPLRGEAPVVEEYPHVLLVRDDWDDYGYKTTFDAFLVHSADDRTGLGNVKILRADQQAGFTPLPAGPFETLDENYCSLGPKLSYYETLFNLGTNIYRPYLRGLRDVAFDDEVRARFEDLEGYRVSLMRFSGAERTIADASRLFVRRAMPSKSTKGFVMKFKTSLAQEAASFVTEFDFRRRKGLPNRINAVIGYNGTGKTRLLSNLAIVASGYGYADKEDILAFRAGRFVGTPPPFKTVVVISYSAFDTFVIPGSTQAEKDRIEESGDIFGYIYCGLRQRVEGDDLGLPETYTLRTPEQIEAEFLSALNRVDDTERADALAEILEPLLQDASFQRIGISDLFTGRSRQAAVRLFRSLSSGHKIVLKIVTELTAHIEDDQPTLVLIDEPETHLHPPLVAALIKSIRACLDRFDGYAVIATHSPVVLQETPSRYVHVLRRMGEVSRVIRPKIETFAENIGVITQEVFNLDEGVTDWHETLRRLAKRYSLEEIEEMFDRRLGFAARSYVADTKDSED